MFLVVTREISVGRAQILPIHKIRKMAAHQRPGFFRCYIDQSLFWALNEPSNAAGTSAHNFSVQSFLGLHSHRSSPDVEETFGGRGAITSPPEKTAGDSCQSPFQLPERYAIGFLISHALRKKRDSFKRWDQTE